MSSLCGMWSDIVGGIGIGLLLGIMLTGYVCMDRTKGAVRFQQAWIARDGPVQGPVWPGPRPVTIKVLTTGYCSGEGLRCGIHPVFDDGITATGVVARRGICAVDPQFIPLGTVMYVHGYGKCLAADTGNLVKGLHIDLFFQSRGEARQWGRRMAGADIIRWGK